MPLGMPTHPPTARPRRSDVKLHLDDIYVASTTDAFNLTCNATAPWPLAGAVDCMRMCACSLAEAKNVGALCKFWSFRPSDDRCPSAGPSCELIKEADVKASFRFTKVSLQQGAAAGILSGYSSVDFDREHGCFACWVLLSLLGAALSVPLCAAPRAYAGCAAAALHATECCLPWPRRLLRLASQRLPLPCAPPPAGALGADLETLGGNWISAEPQWVLGSGTCNYKCKPWQLPPP